MRIKFLVLPKQLKYHQRSNQQSQIYKVVARTYFAGMTADPARLQTDRSIPEERARMRRIVDQWTIEEEMEDLKKLPCETVAEYMAAQGTPQPARSVRARI